MGTLIIAFIVYKLMIENIKLGTDQVVPSTQADLQIELWKGDLDFVLASDSPEKRLEAGTKSSKASKSSSSSSYSSSSLSVDDDSSDSSWSASSSTSEQDVDSTTIMSSMSGGNKGDDKKCQSHQTTSVDLSSEIKREICLNSHHDSRNEGKSQTNDSNITISSMSEDELERLEFFA
jgi:hypothetical protein